MQLLLMSIVVILRCYKILICILDYWTAFEFGLRFKGVFELHFLLFLAWPLCAGVCHCYGMIKGYVSNFQ
jgi:hypothetical protein